MYMYIPFFTTLRSIEFLYRQNYFLLYSSIHPTARQEYITEAASQSGPFSWVTVYSTTFWHCTFIHLFPNSVSFGLFPVSKPSAIASVIYSLYQTTILSQRVSCRLNSHASNELHIYLYTFSRFFQMILFAVSAFLRCGM